LKNHQKYLCVLDGDWHAVPPPQRPALLKLTSSSLAGLLRVDWTGIFKFAAFKAGQFFGEIIYVGNKLADRLFISLLCT